jgi:hypothetical protein
MCQYETALSGCAAWPVLARFNQMNPLDNTWLLLAYLSPLIIAMTIIDIRGSLYGRRVLRLPKGNFVRRLVLEALDPVMELLFIGVVLWRDLSSDPWHMVAGGAGIVGGYFLARYRARIMYVRALPEYQAIIVRRSFAEYIVVVFLITVKLLSENTTLENYAVSLFITAGLMLLLSESALRISIVYRRYRRETVDARAAFRVLKRAAKSQPSSN